ncbi:MAG: outer membrane beta-barrel family protein, partial [Alistipes sp.]|nr:outer membrane beta-barrel family protein [Alistipes sp.]
GAQIMVNDRILNMDDEQAISYLRSINAEDIARVEIVPRAGADQDASASGGIIKITLRKKRDAGLEISPAYRARFTKNSYFHRPSITLNFRKNKLSFYLNAYNYHDKTFVDLEENNISGNTVTDSYSKVKGRSHDGGGRFGIIYDINERQSLGAEYATYMDNSYNKINPFTAIYSPDLVSTDSSRYRQVPKTRNHYAAVNYILRLDSLGSVFKVIGDVSLTDRTGDNTFRNRHTYLPGSAAGMYRDTLYRNDSRNNYTVATGTASLEKVLSGKSRLQAGLKFVYTSLDDDSRYYGNDLPTQTWEFDRRYSVAQRYTEKIAAGYASFSSVWGPVSYSLGLRGEYTHATPVTSLYDGTAPQKNRNTYFSLFPNINVSVPIAKEKGHTVNVFYARKINRPGYWALNPFRMQISEYSYIIGDPMLNPAYINETGVSFVLKHKYTLTASYRSTGDKVEQYVSHDEQNPETVIYRYSNLSSSKDATLSLNLPVEFSDKIGMNANVYYAHSRMDPGNGGAKIISNNVFTNASLNFTLPKAYRLEVTGWYTSGQNWGNMKVKSMGDVNIAIRKRFLKDALSVAAEVNNILEFKSHQRMVVKEEGFLRKLRQDQSYNKRLVILSLRYTFKTGIKANGRHVERGGDDSR